MKVLVDADACPVTRIVERIAKEHALECILLCGDIVVTQDYGVAAMILGKGAYGIHQSGKWYTNENIDQMLMERHLAKKARMGKGKHHLKGPSKRTEEDDKYFAESFEKLVKKVINDEKERNQENVSISI